jgi:hypothetical protein
MYQHVFLYLTIVPACFLDFTRIFEENYSSTSRSQHRLAQLSGDQKKQGDGTHQIRKCMVLSAHD